MRRIQEMQNPQSAALRSMLDRVETLKGEKGEKGESPVKYVDYFTPEEVDAIVAHIRSQIRDGVDGKDGIDGVTPKKGTHYRDGVDGRDGKDGIGKNGKDGKDGVSPSMEAIIAELRKDPIHYTQVEGAPDPKDLAQLIAFLKRGGFRGGGSSSAPTAGFTVLIPTAGLVNGTNQTFMFSSAPSVIVLDNGNAMNKVSSDGTVNWTGTTTVVLNQAPNFNIFGY